MSHHYVPEAARGVRWDDPAFGIDWPAARSASISERDRSWPDLHWSSITAVHDPCLRDHAPGRTGSVASAVEPAP